MEHSSELKWGALTLSLTLSGSSPCLEVGVGLIVAAASEHLTAFRLLCVLLAAFFTLSNQSQKPTTAPTAATAANGPPDRPRIHVAPSLFPVASSSS